MKTVPQFFQIHAAHTEGFITDQLRRRKFIKFIQKVPEFFYFRNHKSTGGHICKSDPESVGNIGHGHDIVVFRLIQCLGIEVGSRRHHPNHFPLYNTLGQPGIFHLFTDGDLISFLHQPVDIIIRCMKGDAAHGRPLGQTTILSRESQLQFSGYSFRILEKHLIEVSQTVK